MKEVEGKVLFGNISLWIRSQATILVIFEADYEIKLLLITSGKMGDILKLKLKKKLFGYCF